MDARKRWLTVLLIAAGCAGTPRADQPSDIAPLPATVPDRGSFEDRVREALRGFRADGDAEPARQPSKSG